MRARDRARRPSRARSQILPLGESELLPERLVVVLGEVRREGDLEHPVGVPAADVSCLDRGLDRGLELLDRELANRLEHPEALLAEAARPSPHEALVEERRERVEIGVADCLGRLERAAPAEDRESPEEPLLVLVEQVVRPGDRRSQRRVALVGVACPLRAGRVAASMSLEQHGSGARSFVRAAASSTASGRWSRRAQSSVTCSSSRQIRAYSAAHAP